MRTPTSVGARDDAWIALLGGVRISRRWLTRHTPDLLRAWQDAPSAAARRIIARAILHIAADPDGDKPQPSIPGQLTVGDWRAVLAAHEPRLLDGPDWAPLAAALARAQAAGYDVAARLPSLLAAGPLPDRHPARELHWRLLADCPAALPAPNHPARATDPVAPPSTDPAAPRPGATAGPEGGRRAPSASTRQKRGPR